MKRLLMFLLTGITSLCFFTGTIRAATITGTAPQYAPLQGLIDAAFTAALVDANDELAKYEDQKDLAKGFANANIYSSQAATFQGYQNYKLFAITAGAMVGLQAPSIKPSYYDQIGDDLEEKGDVQAGLGAGISYFNIGLNAGLFVPKLYVNLKFGSLTIRPSEEVKIKNTLVGIGANYGLIKGGGMGWGLAKWRGISIGTGFIYHKSEVDLEVELDEIRQFVNVDNDLVLDPSINLGIDVVTYTIPFDITTSIQFLWLFNLTLGAGVDFSFGNSDIIIASGGAVYIDGTASGLATPGSLTVDGSTKGVGPSFVRPRLMAGLGFNISVVKIDIPVIYYPEAGAAIGITAGVVW